MAPRIFPRVTATLPASGVVMREPYARGLVAAFAPGAGVGLTDLISGLMLTASNDAVVSTGGGTTGLVCGVTNAQCKVTCPEWLKLSVPLTLVARLAFVATPAVNSSIFGVSSNNIGASPFRAYSFSIDASGFLRLAWSDGATFREYPGNVAYRRAPVVGRPFTMVGLFTATQATIYFGPDEGAVTSLACNPTYSATSELTIGGNGLTGVVLEYGLIYNRRLAPSELKLFRENPYHWLRPSAAQQFAGVGV